MSSRRTTYAPTHNNPQQEQYTQQTPLDYHQQQPLQRRPNRSLYPSSKPTSSSSSMEAHKIASLESELVRKSQIIDELQEDIEQLETAYKQLQDRYDHDIESYKNASHQFESEIEHLHREIKKKDYQNDEMEDLYRRAIDEIYVTLERNNIDLVLMKQIEQDISNINQQMLQKCRLIPQAFNQQCMAESEKGGRGMQGDGIHSHNGDILSSKRSDLLKSEEETLNDLFHSLGLSSRQNAHHPHHQQQTSATIPQSTNLKHEDCVDLDLYHDLLRFFDPTLPPRKQRKVKQGVQHPLQTPSSGSHSNGKHLHGNDSLDNLDEQFKRELDIAKSLRRNARLSITDAQHNHNHNHADHTTQKNSQAGDNHAHQKNGLETQVFSFAEIEKAMPTCDTNHEGQSMRGDTTPSSSPSYRPHNPHMTPKVQISSILKSDLVSPSIHQNQHQSHQPSMSYQPSYHNTDHSGNDNNNNKENITPPHYHQQQNGNHLNHRPQPQQSHPIHTPRGKHLFSTPLKSSLDKSSMQTPTKTPGLTVMHSSRREYSHNHTVNYHNNANDTDNNSKGHITNQHQHQRQQQYGSSPSTSTNLIPSDVQLSNHIKYTSTYSTQYDTTHSTLHNNIKNTMNTTQTTLLPPFSSIAASTAHNNTTLLFETPTMDPRDQPYQPNMTYLDLTSSNTVPASSSSLQITSLPSSSQHQQQHQQHQQQHQQQPPQTVSRPSHRRRKSYFVKDEDIYTMSLDQMINSVLTPQTDELASN